MKSILKNGSQWPTAPILEDEQPGNVEEALKFGNHKGATSQQKLLLKLVSNTVIYGYANALPCEKVIQLLHVCMAPLNIKAQWTINGLGEIVAKDCLTHDQSFKWETSRTTVNSHCDSDKLPKCMFRKCLLRLINRTVAACWKYPNCRIFAKKDNFKSAYHCCHLHWETASKTMT